MKKFSFLLFGLCLSTTAFSQTSVSLKLSGDGVINDSTIAIGKKVSVDVYVENEGNFKGMTLGFKLFSNNIKKVIHPSDTTKSLNSNGDIKAYNGWQDKSIWDMGGLYVAPTDWDGTLPDNIGFGGVSMKNVYSPHTSEKKISFDLIFEETGTFIIDSAFFKPSGKWLFAPPTISPKWNGPYTITVKK